MNGTCSRCNRPLKVESSLVRGVGPICWTKILADAQANAQEPENIHWEHLAIVASRIRLDFRRGDGQPVPPSIEASLVAIAAIAVKPDPDVQDRALVAANAWTIAAEVPDEVLVDAGFMIIQHVRNLFDLVGDLSGAEQVDRDLNRRVRKAPRQRTIFA